MAKETVELIGSPGIIRDTPAHKLVSNAFSDGENIRFGEDGAESLVGDTSTFSAASITPLWIGYFPPITDPRWVYANTTAVWCYQGSTHTDITRTVGGAYAGSAAERWQSTMFNGVGILNNTLDIPQQWTDIDSSTDLANLSNWTSTRRCKSLRSFKNFLVALYMTDSGTARPYRILWSDSADSGTVPGSWDSTDPATDSREFDLAQTSDYLVDQLELGGINVIYKEETVWGMQWVGPPNYFRFWNILPTNGLLHRDCMVNIPQGQLAVGQDDMYFHTGQVQSAQSVLNRKWRDRLFSTIDTSNYQNSFLVANHRKNEAYFFFPESGETYANQVLIWNWDDNSIGSRELTTSVPFAAAGPVGESVVDAPQWNEA